MGAAEQDIQKGQDEQEACHLSMVARCGETVDPSAVSGGGANMAGGGSRNP